MYVHPGFTRKPFNHSLEPTLSTSFEVTIASEDEILRFGFWIQGAGLRIHGLESEIWDLGFRDSELLV